MQQGRGKVNQHVASREAGPALQQQRPGTKAASMQSTPRPLRKNRSEDQLSCCEYTGARNLLMQLLSHLVANDGCLHKL
eukprot:scaffold127127_cov19-Tisochrysis_lutea.AAC.1